MNKLLLILPLIGIPIIFLSMGDFQEKEFEGAPKIEFENPTEEKILNELREITEEEVLLETQLPDLELSEKIMENGIRLSSDYNQVSYDYSAGKFFDKQYFSKLFDFRIKYEKYMTAIDVYIGDEDILSLRNSMIQELEEINQQINLLKNSESIEEGWELTSNYDRYKKLLPSMFVP